MFKFASVPSLQFLFSLFTAGNKKERQGSEVLTLLLQALQSIVSSEALPAPQALVNHLTLQMAALEKQFHWALAENINHKYSLECSLRFLNPELPAPNNYEPLWHTKT